MKTVPFSVLAAVLLLASFASAEPVETEIANVTAEVAELRTSGGVTRLAVRYINGGTKTGRDRPLSWSTGSCWST